MSKSVKNFDLLNILNGYVRNYRRLNIHSGNNWSFITMKEIEYFSTLGELLGYYSFTEDWKKDTELGRSRPMDLSWWEWDGEAETDSKFTKLILHLERENQSFKSFETIDKLFSKVVSERYKPQFVIGIMIIDSQEQIQEINEYMRAKNIEQKSEVLLIYHYLDKENNIDKMDSYYFNADNEIISNKNAVSYIDQTDYWTMSFIEDYKAILK